MQRKIIVNGREYASVEDMPDDVRRAYENALAQLPDADRDGIPDVLEDRGTTHVVATRRASISFNGRTVETEGPVPALLHRLFDAASDVQSGHGDAATVSRRSGDGAARLDRVQRSVANAMWVLLSVLAAIVLTVGVLMITTIDASSRSQGGRIYVVVAVVIALAAIVKQADRAAQRQWGAPLGTSSMVRRFAIWSTLALLLATGVLVALAVLLP